MSLYVLMCARDDLCYDCYMTAFLYVLTCMSALRLREFFLRSMSWPGLLVVPLIA